MIKEPMSCRRRSASSKSLHLALILVLAMNAAVSGVAAAEGAQIDEIARATRIIDRDEIERSGAITLADLLRKEAVMVFGMSRPTPFSDNTSVSAANLHGVGSQHTLVLIDGRRLMTSASLGDTQNLNAIPLAAVE